MVVFGASGDLAKKKTLPALYRLFESGALPASVAVLGVARSAMADREWREALSPHLPTSEPQARAMSRRITPQLLRAPPATAARSRVLGLTARASLWTQVAEFLKRCAYIRVRDYGPHDEAYGAACMVIEYLEAAAAKSAQEAGQPPPRCGRLFYLATPPDVFPLAAAAVATRLSPDADGEAGDVPAASQAAQAALRRALRPPQEQQAAPPPQPAWVRVVVEKPFGRDAASAAQLEASLRAHFAESQLYRIDHYLGKELVKNLVVLRFANPILGPLFCRERVAAVVITLKEPFGTAGRAGYFDAFGVVRDVIQNHLLQVFALLAMERPVSLAASDVRDEKNKVLRCVAPVAYPRDVVLGQYDGYAQEPGVRPGSRTPTFAACVLRVRNDRWAGVPFILKAGKALDERKTEVRIQFKDAPDDLCGFGAASAGRNELVIRVQPKEAMYLKLTVKRPDGGLGGEPSAAQSAARGESCGCSGGGVALAVADAAAGNTLPSIPTQLAELDLDYSRRYGGVRIPEAYERLIADAIAGDASNFVRCAADEHVAVLLVALTRAGRCVFGAGTTLWTLHGVCSTPFWRRRRRRARSRRCVTRRVAAGRQRRMSCCCARASAARRGTPGDARTSEQEPCATALAARVQRHPARIADTHSSYRFVIT